ncbi:MAG: hypothetical protein R2856_14765 [Caldilineaceae bacterium]
MLEVDETWTYTGAYTVQQNRIDNNGGGDGDIDNTAVSSEQQLGDESDSAAVDADPVTGLHHCRTADVSSVSAWVTQLHTIVVANTGNQSLTGVTVSDPLLGTLTGPVESPAWIASLRSVKPGPTQVPTPCTGRHRQQRRRRW